LVYLFGETHAHTQKVSEMATISDEAFAYLLVENYWDDWSKKELEEYFAEACFDNSIMKWKKRKTTWGKYTKGAWGARQYTGWQHDALLGSINYVRKSRKTERKMLSQKISTKLTVSQIWQIPKNQKT